MVNREKEYVWGSKLLNLVGAWNYVLHGKIKEHT